MLSAMRRKTPADNQQLQFDFSDRGEAKNLEHLNLLSLYKPNELPLLPEGQQRPLLPHQSSTQRRGLTVDQQMPKAHPSRF